MTDTGETGALGPGLMGPPWVPDHPLAARPKVSLHDHLDGSVWPATLAEIASAQGSSNALPGTDPRRVEAWLRGLDEGVRPFDHNGLFALLCSVMQTPDTIARVAAEYVEVLAADGVVYAEVRWAPEKHQDRGLSLDDTVLAVRAGLTAGARAAAKAGHVVEVRQVLCAIRDTDRAADIVDLALRHRANGVVGVDLAGVELGHPAAPHAAAFDHARAEGLAITIHAGEGDGVASVQESLDLCHAQRIGHGTRLVEDLRMGGEPLGVRGAVARWDAAGRPELEFGAVAERVRAGRIPLEQCVTSNSRWIVPGWSDHPVDLLRRNGFVVTINPDNRMLSGTSVTAEFVQLAETFGWTLAAMATATLAAIDAAFVDADTKRRLRDEVIAPGWADALS